MKMKDRELFVEQMIRQLMKAQLHDLDNTEQGNSNHISLESKTLNRVLLYILLHESRLNEEENPRIDKEIVERLDQVIEDSRREFEEVLNLIDEKL